MDNYIQNEYGYCQYDYELDGSAVIYNLYIYPEHRRKGHATAIIKSLITKIREEGYKGEITIEAVPREDIDLESLVLFYKKMGLKIL